mmetsp:Transcript_18074/g.44953  ORF Transcript_18074/g.44953 Transcript_18074/m.44953 type:complete len:216 (+) Transcript_18074:3716-4363(+)
MEEGKEKEQKGNKETRERENIYLLVTTGMGATKHVPLSQSAPSSCSTNAFPLGWLLPKRLFFRKLAGEASSGLSWTWPSRVQKCRLPCPSKSLPMRPPSPSPPRQDCLDTTAWIGQCACRSSAFPAPKKETWHAERRPSFFRRPRLPRPVGPSRRGPRPSVDAVYFVHRQTASPPHFGPNIAPREARRDICQGEAEAGIPIGTVRNPTIAWSSLV